MALRCFYFDHSGKAVRLPVARWNRILGEPPEPRPEWSDQTIRLAVVTVELEHRRPARIIRARFGRYKFDLDGRYITEKYADFWEPTSWERQQIRHHLAKETGRQDHLLASGPFRFRFLDPNPDPCAWCDDGEDPIPGTGDWAGHWVHATGYSGLPYFYCTDDRWIGKAGPEPHLRLVEDD